MENSPKWRVELFGGLRARCGERVVERFRTQKTGALLGYLALHADRMHSREVLVELFWPGAGSDPGRNSLSTCLWYLRRELCSASPATEDVILADRAAVGLRSEAISTDVQEFASAVEHGRAAQGEERLASLTRAADLYAGEFLRGYYEAWIVAEQRRFAELFHEALTGLTTILEGQGERPRALELAVRGVEADPLREESHREVIRLQLAAGHPQQAVQQFRTLENVLSKELHAAPVQETRALVAPLLGAAADRLSRPRVAVSASEPGQELARAVPFPSGTYAVLLAEPVGESVPDSDWRSVAQALRRAARQRGAVATSGSDRAVAVFPFVESALACATARRPAEPATDALTLRMAVDLGRLEVRAARLTGPVLKHAMHLLRAAKPGEVVCSASAAALATLAPEPACNLVDRGLCQLAREAAPERVFRLERGDPSPADERPRAAAAPSAPSVPAPLTRFFGRGPELTRLRKLLTTGSTRLVTLLGPSGLGKTRLATELANRVGEALAGAVWFVPLATVEAAERLADAVLRAVHDGPGAAGAEPLRQLVEAFGRRPGLLILDNYEHLLPEGGDFLEALLIRTTDLRCLITSRRRIGLRGEREFALQPLPTPGSAATRAQLLRCPSVQLFTDRVQALSPAFQVTAANAATVAELCTGLEGIPLSLELAAARSGCLTLTEMLQSLSRRFDLLVTQDNYRAARHRSVRAAVESSLASLTPELRRFFAKLSVFRGGWTLDAAEEVCGEPLAGDRLAELRDVSLVEADTSGAQTRFSMLETLRELAAEQLPASERLARRHADYYVALAERADLAVDGPEQEAWMDRLEVELPNLRAALAWALANRPTQALQLAVTLGQFWEVHGHRSEGREAVCAVLARAPRTSASLRARGEGLAGWLSYLLGDDERARPLLEAALKRSTRIDDWACASRVHYALGHFALAHERLDESRHHYEQCLALRRAAGNEVGASAALEGLGDVAAANHDYDAARRLIEESLQINRRYGSARAIALGLHRLAVLDAEQGELDSAERAFQETLTLFRQAGDRTSAAGATGELAQLALRRGDPATARARLRESLTEMRELGSARGTAGGLFLLGQAAAAEGDHRGAVAAFEECAAIRHTIGEHSGMAAALEELAQVQRRSGHLPQAVRHYAAAAVLRQATTPDETPPSVSESVADLQGALGTEAFGRAWDEGLAHGKRLLESS